LLRRRILEQREVNNDEFLGSVKQSGHSKRAELNQKQSGLKKVIMLQ
jgi:hypothetical protein